MMSSWPTYKLYGKYKQEPENYERGLMENLLTGKMEMSVFLEEDKIE